MTDNTTELDFGTTAQKATDAEKLPVVLLALDQGRYDMGRSLDELGALSPTAFFERLYRHRFNDTPPSPELLGAFAELLVDQAEPGEHA